MRAFEQAVQREMRHRLNVRLAGQLKCQAAELGGRLSQARHRHFVLPAGDEKPRLIAAVGDRRQIVRVVEHVGRIFDLARVGDERAPMTVSSPSGSCATPGEPVIGSGNACVRSCTNAR